MHANPEQATQRRELPEAVWEDYLQELSRGCAGACTSVRVGTGTEPRLRGAGMLNLPLRLLRYDPRRREIEVAMGERASHPALRCFIRDTRRVFTAHSPAGSTIVVVSRAGIRTLIEISADSVCTSASAAADAAARVSDPSRARGGPSARGTARGTESARGGGLGRRPRRGQAVC